MYPFTPLEQYDQIDNWDFVKTTLHNFLLIPNWSIIGGFGDAIQDDRVMSPRPGHWGIFDETFGSRDLPFSEDWKQCEILLCESYSEYFMLLMAGKAILGDRSNGVEASDNLFFFDEMAVEMSLFGKSKEPTILLLAHSQIYLDIIRVMGPSARKGVKDMRGQFREMSEMLKRRKSIESKIFPPDWTPAEEKMSAGLQATLESWSTNDPMDNGRRSMERAFGRPRMHSRFMERAPMLCGTMLFRYKLLYQEVGFDLADSWCSIMATAHLVTACRHYDDLAQVTSLASWPDMDFVIKRAAKETSKKPGKDDS